MLTIILVILVLILLGGFGNYGGRGLFYGTGYYGGGGLGIGGGRGRLGLGRVGVLHGINSGLVMVFRPWGLYPMGPKDPGVQAAASSSSSKVGSSVNCATVKLTCTVDSS